MVVEIPRGSRNKYEMDHETGEVFLDRTLFTANANSYFTDQAIADYKSSLAPLGAPVAVTVDACVSVTTMSTRATVAEFWT